MGEGTVRRLALQGEGDRPGLELTDPDRDAPAPIVPQKHEMLGRQVLILVHVDAHHLDFFLVQGAGRTILGLGGVVFRREALFGRRPAEGRQAAAVRVKFGRLPIVTEEFVEVAWHSLTSFPFPKRVLPGPQNRPVASRRSAPCG